MNISKFTQKSVQAVQDLEKVAYQFGNQEIEEEHLLYALLEQEDSLILKLIEKMEINKDYFVDTVKKAFEPLCTQVNEITTAESFDDVEAK